MRLTVLMRETPFVVPMIETGDATHTRRNTTASRYAATRCDTQRHRMLAKTFHPGRLRYVRQRPDRLTRSCSNEKLELLAEILDVFQRWKIRVGIESTDTCRGGSVRPLLVLFGRRFSSLQLGWSVLRHRFRTLSIST
jgi:hypothetical protein